MLRDKVHSYTCKKQAIASGHKHVERDCREREEERGKSCKQFEYGQFEWTISA